MTEQNSKIQSQLLIDDSLHFIFENVESGVLIENTGRLIEFTNETFCKLFDIKFTPQELRHSSILENVRGFSMLFEKSADFAKSKQEIPEKNIVIKGERWKLRNGKIIVRDYAPIYKNNQLSGHIWIYKEHKQIHSLHITNTNTIIENALHLLPNEIAIFNINAQILYANKAYINSEEKRLWAKNKTLEQYFSYNNLPIEVAKKRTQHIMEAAASAKAIMWSETVVNHQNEKLYQSRVCFPVLNDVGKIESVIEQSTDVTNIVTLENQLKQATDYMFATLNQLNDFVIQTDGELKLQFVNKAWENMTGQYFEDFNGKPIFDILSVTRYELYQKMFAILNGDTSQRAGIISLKDKSGKDKQLEDII